MGSAYNNYIQQAATATFPKRAKKKKKQNIGTSQETNERCMYGYQQCECD